MVKKKTKTLELQNFPIYCIMWNNWFKFISKTHYIKVEIVKDMEEIKNNSEDHTCVWYKVIVYGVKNGECIFTTKRKFEQEMNNIFKIIKKI